MTPKLMRVTSTYLQTPPPPQVQLELEKNKALCHNFTGSPTATALFFQIAYYELLKGRAFYKFIIPCKHELYRTGDSFTENLNIKKSALYTALSNLTFKLISNSSFNSLTAEEKEEYLYKKEKALILSYRDKNNVTFYKVQWNIVLKEIEKLSLNLTDLLFIADPETTEQSDDIEIPFQLRGIPSLFESIAEGEK